MNPFHSLLESPDGGSSLPLLSASLSAAPLSFTTTSLQPGFVPKATPLRLSSAEDYFRSGVSAGLLGESAEVAQGDPDYWRKYRQDHLEQVERNRRQQRARDQKRRFVNLANNNLAHGQVLFFQSPDPSGLLSAASCKQQPSCAVPTAGLKVHPCCQGSSSRVFGLRDFGIILRGPCFKALLELYLRQATPRSPLADISGQLNTSSIGPLGPACR
jgi:hypothetical protein